MKPFPVLLFPALLMSSSIALRAQAVVEHSAVTAAGAAGAAAAKGVGKSAGSILGSVEKLARDGAKTGTATAPAASRPAGSIVVSTRPAKPERVASCADGAVPSAIAIGLTRKDLLRKFGEPCMKITKSQGSLLIETYWYTPANRDGLIVTLREGKVTAVSPAPSQQTTAVVILE